MPDGRLPSAEAITALHVRHPNNPNPVSIPIILFPDDPFHELSKVFQQRIRLFHPRFLQSSEQGSLAGFLPVAYCQRTSALLLVSRPKGLSQRDRQPRRHT